MGRIGCQLPDEKGNEKGSDLLLANLETEHEIETIQTCLFSNKPILNK